MVEKDFSRNSERCSQSVSLLLLFCPLFFSFYYDHSCRDQDKASHTVLRVICQTRDSVSSGYPNTEKRVKTEYFDEIRGVWIADETLSLVFDVSSQSKQKLRSKRRSKIVKIYAN